MATVTKPIALDRSLNTTESPSRNIADVLAEELSAMITAIGGLNFINFVVVAELPTTGISTTTIYLVPSDDPQSENTYDEYINLNGTVSGWEKIGSTDIDLSGYYTSAETDALLDEKVDKDSFDEQTATDTFETINGGLLSSLKVSLSPNQDLHGYDSPWVGGSRKNKLPLPTAETKNGITLTHNADGSLTLEPGTATATTYFDFFAGNFDSTAYAGYLFRADSEYTSWGAATVLFRISDSDRAQLQSLNGNSDIAINDNGNGLYFALRVANGFVIPSGGITIYPMLRNSTETATFEPYSNICPISGHTQVDVDVSDGDTTQEQVTVNLGGTYYSGTLDVVSGELTVDSAFIASYNGESLPSTWISDRDVYAVGITPTTGAEVCYKLATPQTIQLSPTMVKALVGENHLSAPLEGQEITESKYKQMFTFDDVIAYIQSLS